MTGSKEGLNLWINDQKHLFLITARFDIPEGAKQSRGWQIEISQILDIVEILRSLLKNEYREARPDEMPIPIMEKPEKGLRLFTVHDAQNFYVMATSDVPGGMKQTGQWRIEPLKLFEIAFEVEEILKYSYRGAELSEIPKYSW